MILTKPLTSSAEPMFSRDVGCLRRRFELGRLGKEGGAVVADESEMFRLRIASLLHTLTASRTGQPLVEEQTPPSRRRLSSEGEAILCA